MPLGVFQLFHWCFGNSDLPCEPERSCGFRDPIGFLCGARVQADVRRSLTGGYIATRIPSGSGCGR
jgi:hypothetical protein